MSKLYFLERRIFILSELVCCTNNNHLFGYSYNTKIKIYNDNTFKVKYTSYSIVKGLPKLKKKSSKSSISLEAKEHLQRQYLKFTRQQILDLALNNQDKWEYFLTLTFSDSELGGYSHEKAIRKLCNWLIVQRRNNPNMYYLIVPEFHKSGRLHFHGLVGNVPKWQLEKARNKGRLIRVNGKQIYNLINYTLGFSTISFIEDKQKVANYICKYVTKELIDLKNKKRYWYSRNISYPRTYYTYFEGNIMDLSKHYNVLYHQDIKKDNCTISIANFQL